jgi:iron uptake system EfeUOB component EfeO/EfeM
VTKPHAALLTVAVLALTGLSGCTGHAAAGAAVEVSRGGCGLGWTAPHGGRQTVRVHNVGPVTMEVELVDPGTHGVYAEIESLAPGTTRPVSLVLARGSYAFTCLPEDSDAETGPTVTVTDGPATGASPIAPVSEADLGPAVATYRKQVGAGLATLAGDVTALRTALASGDRARSRAAWLVAQTAYSRLGAAYDTFGEAAAAIDGLPAPDTGDFTGLRRIERGLWHGEPLPALATVAARLATDVAGLRKDFDHERTDPNDLPLRAHEILENTLQSELTGDADQGAGAGLAIMSANLEGTRMVLDAIAPEIQQRYPRWTTVTGELGALKSLVDAQHRGGRWTPVAALSRADHERLDGALGRLLEDLAPIAAIGEVRRTQ